MKRTINVPLAQDCSTCIIDSLQKLIPLLSDDKHSQFELYSIAFKRLSKGFEEREEPAPLSIQLYRELYLAANNMDPYSEIKLQSNEAARNALPKIREIINHMDGFERFHAALASSVVGNVIDYNTAGHNPDLNELETLYEEITKQGFQIDNSEDLWKKITNNTGSLLFLADNAGETYFDIPLLEIIKKHGWKIYYIVKGQAMVNDATIDDVKGTEIESLAEIRTTGAWAHGTPIQWISDEFMELVRNSDLVISKGQANIETFPEIQLHVEIDTYYILRGKCPHISRAIGAKKGDNIILRVP
jgi:uncharacterized protein with ATP-grasp and redox domains